jgi:D-3-phosphoglycerate dehydrogenase
VTQSPDASRPRPVVLIAEELSPATVDALGPDFEIRYCDGADRTALLRAIADAEAILVRSATQVDAEALAAASGSRSSPAPAWASTTSTSAPRPRVA